MIDSDGYEIETYRVIYYAELGWIDGGGIGYWMETKESHPFTTKADAEKFLANHPDTEIVKFGGGFSELRPTYSMGKCRVDRRLEIIS